ncbi:SMC-Scp complex subunit ScpB [Anaerosalibacter bizertensis]|uniref:Segregation and condensation protein B n=1 Tax=Anaerosalibacter bizertensis TaxID=932217 RepID=A0A844FG01_9FIRM|nr:SMC-Scp complex subunit ScpB [Anaerosalibacter bizertensis]MBV1817416.1 SMC-Scp complex subunit ScpB [Bacteroidales bacterium MSK.15.36]HHV27728.1 SMC-Scp complex subunit ScpB [Tissierellia bacterium]MBU5293191.1 SMC-Scp complex subunit ScpB [Anaerosalibacter bizertensis]MCB5558496.1 SMC-Scp complex subunit ScpB [Anaerosalibacter bizertensis]MCG4564260.1 SMC-Scp complex subunit ScpB [Anaerosalibacter bizertensis]
MDKKEIKSIIEALLFIWGDPLSLKDISYVLEIDEKKTKEIIHEMIDEFNFDRRGIKIIQIEDSYQLGTRAEHFKWIEKLSIPKTKKNLSNAALETLSIIAYRQPITKSEIEAIRGVRCDKALDTLLEKEIIEEKGRLEKTGRPIIYGTTKQFLKYFGLGSLNELPSLNDFKTNN